MDTLFYFDDKSVDFCLYMRVVVYIYTHVQVFFPTPPHSSFAAKPWKPMGTQLSLRSRNRMLLRRRVIGSSLGKFHPKDVLVATICYSVATYQTSLVPWKAKLFSCYATNAGLLCPRWITEV